MNRRLEIHRPTVDRKPIYTDKIFWELEENPFLSLIKRHIPFIHIDKNNFIRNLLICFP